MKSSTATAVLALAASSMAATIPFRPKFIEDGKPNPNGGFALKNKHGRVALDQYKCIQMNSYIGDWYLSFAGGIYGTDSITISGAGETICVPTNDGVGGAMYIGGYGFPNDKSTKLETFFPSSGQAYVDISIVDGYSISMSCVADQLVSNLGVLGGYTDLWQDGIPCPDKQGANCLNHNAYNSDPNTVDQFFQAGHRDNNDYCITQYCDIPNFPVQNHFTCTVSGSRV